LLVCDWPHSVWTKSLICKDAVLQRIPLFRSVSEDSEVRKFWFHVSRLDDRAIPSERSSVHCSIRPNNVPYRPDARQTKHHLSGRRGFPSGPFTASRSFCSSLHPSGRLSSPSERRLVIDQLQIFFPSSNKGRLMQPSGRRGFPSGCAHT
jgi:hypothetical protein